MARTLTKASNDLPKILRDDLRSCWGSLAALVVEETTVELRYALMERERRETQARLDGTAQANCVEQCGAPPLVPWDCLCETVTPRRSAYEQCRTPSTSFK